MYPLISSNFSVHTKLVRDRRHQEVTYALPKLAHLSRYLLLLYWGGCSVAKIIMTNYKAKNFIDFAFQLFEIGLVKRQRRWA